MADMTAFSAHESEVRSYCRSFPAVFVEARGAELVDEEGNEYIDFFAGAGALNYGHNHPRLKRALLGYLSSDAPVHMLDFATGAKRTFLERFSREILGARGLDHRVQFTGPTGTNSVEAALKLARKVTGRSGIVSFTNAFHGMTVGSLSVTGNAFKRAGAGVPLGHATSVPYDGFLGDGVDSLDYLEAMIDGGSTGLDAPAAVIVETVQAEGGVNVASTAWLRRLRELTRRRGILLVIDDVQVGCGRTGRFFSFEEAGIEPDLVCLSKSLSGYGLPFALLLIRPELDVWEPGEHNGTFRGFNPAMVTATAALDFWTDDAFARSIGEKAAVVRARLCAMRGSGVVDVRGRGLVHGIELAPGLAPRVSEEAFRHGVLVETAGPDNEVVKLLPPLTIEEGVLARGLDVLERAVALVTKRARPSSRPPAAPHQEAQ